MTLPGVTPGRLVLAAVAASFAVFCIVQDRIVAAGVGRYVALQRAAISGPPEGGPHTAEGGPHTAEGGPHTAEGGPNIPGVTLDEVMVPAVRRSVREALAWSGGVLAAGLTLAVLRRAPRRGGPSGPPEPR